jgi:hypothetical protein
MAVRVWGEVEDRLVELRFEPAPPGTGLRVEGLAPGRGRTTADRVRAALINAGVLDEAPPWRSGWSRRFEPSRRPS